MLNEFKPSLFFLVRFLGIYFVGNLLYGLYVESFEEKADHATAVVASHTSSLLTMIGYETTTVVNRQGPTVFIQTHDKLVLSVYEGCNGLNVMILFVAFIVAFGGSLRKMSWFIPAGLIIIYIANLTRIAFLFIVSEHFREYFYYVHKYFFTATIYCVVFALWILWVLRHNQSKKENAVKV